MLTIITITKDDFEGLANTVNSTKVLRTDFAVRQIIVDSSTVEIRREIEHFAGQNINVEYVWQEPIGIAPAFNLGLSKVESDWVWFLNSRDEVHPDLDTDLFMRILDTSKSEAIIFELQYMQSKLRLKHPSLSALWPPLYWVPHPATLIKRDLFTTYGGFNQKFKIAMDGELWVRLFSKDIAVDMLSIPIAVYDQNGMSNTQLAAVNKEAAKIIMDNFGLLCRIWLSRGTHLIKALKHFILPTLLL